MESLLDLIDEIANYSLENDTDSESGPLLLRQRVVDAMAKTDERFGSALQAQYDPFLHMDNDTLYILFTPVDDVDAPPLHLLDLDPYPWYSEDIPEEEEEFAISYPRRTPVIGRHRR